MGLFSRRDPAPEPVAKAAVPTELGWSGLQVHGGYVDEEFHPELTGYQYLKRFREMDANDPTVGAVLLNIELLMRQVDWDVACPEDHAEDQVAQDQRDFVASCFDDLSISFNDTRASIMRPMLVYGWTYHEILYKKRLGPDQRDPKKRSRHNDGLIGWRKFPIRAQDTLYRWQIDDHGSIQGMWQQGNAGQPAIFIPIDKALLFRTSVDKNNPEGRSILRNAYRPYRFRKRIEEIEGIGVERDLAGLPVAWVPPSILSDAATGQEAATAAIIKQIVRNIRRDEQEGIVFPLVYDEHGNKLYDLTLLSSGGRRQFETGPIVERYKLDIAQAMIFDFLMLGHEKAGSWALGTTKIDQSMAALDAWLDDIAEVFNSHAIPRLLRLNGMDTAKAPRLVHSSIDHVDLGVLGEFISKIAAAGATVFPDVELEQHLRELAGLPPKSDEEVAAAQELAEAKQEAALAQAQATADNGGIPPQATAGPGQPSGPGSGGKPARQGPADRRAGGDPNK